MRKPDYNKKMIINLIREEVEKFGRSPRMTDCSWSQTAVNLFGSWNRALISAGVPTNKSKRVFCLSPDEIIELIKSKQQALGKTPRMIDCSWKNMAVKVFGSWNAAIEAAGFNVNKI